MTEDELKNYENLKYTFDCGCDYVISILGEFGICEVTECEAFDFEIEDDYIIAHRALFNPYPDIIFPKKYLQLTEKELKRECENLLK